MDEREYLWREHLQICSSAKNLPGAVRAEMGQVSFECLSAPGSRQFTLRATLLLHQVRWRAIGESVAPSLRGCRRLKWFYSQSVRRLRCGVDSSPSKGEPNVSPPQKSPARCLFK